MAENDNPVPDETPEAETPDDATSNESPTATATVDAPSDEPVDAKSPEFAEVDERVVKRLDSKKDRLHGVSVSVWAELGSAEMLIGDLLQLGEGSVVRLDRSVGDPVNLISQGVTLARGEVIVVDDCFAIRIREILSGK